MRKPILLALALTACGKGEFCEARIDRSGSPVHWQIGQITVQRHGDICHVEIRGDTVLMIRDTLYVLSEGGTRVR